MRAPTYEPLTLTFRTRAGDSGVDRSYTRTRVWARYHITGRRPPSMYVKPPSAITARRLPSTKSPWTQESTGIRARRPAASAGYARTIATSFPNRDAFQVAV